jgi:hypothetical protein
MGSAHQLFCEEFNDRLDKAEKIEFQAEQNYRALITGEDMDKNTEFDKEYKSLTDTLRKLEMELPRLKNVKGRRKGHLEHNQHMHEKRLRTKREIELTKQKLEDLRFEMQGRLQYECKTKEEKERELANFRDRFKPQRGPETL